MKTFLIFCFIGFVKYFYFDIFVQKSNIFLLKQKIIKENEFSLEQLVYHKKTLSYPPHFHQNDT